MVAGETGSLVRWLCQRRQSPSAPYQEAVYHSSLQHVMGRQWGVCGGRKQRFQPSLKLNGHSFSKEVPQISPQGSRTSSVCSSEHLELPDQLPTSMAVHPVSSRYNPSLPSRSNASLPSRSNASLQSRSNASLPSRSDVTLPSMPSSRSTQSQVQGSVARSNGQQFRNGSGSQNGASSFTKSSCKGSTSCSSKVATSSGQKESWSPSSSKGVMGCQREENAEENGSVSESDDSTVVHSPNENANQNLVELQQYVSNIKEDNQSLKANLHNLRELVEQQTANLQQREMESRDSVEHQLQEIRDRMEKQGQQLEEIRSSESKLSAQITTVEEAQSKFDDLETKYDGRLSTLEGSCSQIGDVESRLGGRITALEEARSQAQATEARLSGRIDALEQHLRATNTSAAVEA